jgi:hypothetical protein
MESLYETLFAFMRDRLPGSRFHDLLMWSDWHARRYQPNQELKRNVLGMSFRSPIGAAAGLSTSGSGLSSLTHAGFGFAEVGPVTPQREYRSGNVLEIDTANKA